MIWLRVPGSKSMTHRALILAANAPQVCLVENALESLDTDATRIALGQLGAQFVRQGPGVFRCESVALSPSVGGVLDCGNSGTTLRLLLGQAARFPEVTVFDGDDSLRQRPNEGLLQALLSLGARCDSEQFVPLAISGPIHAGKVVISDPKSSQFVSSLLLSLLTLSKGSRLEVEGRLLSKPYVNLTLSMIRRAGGEIAVVETPDATIFTIPGGQVLDCDRIVVEGDWSTAAFPVAASIASGKAVTLMGLNALSVQADRALENILGTLGHRTEWREGMFEVIPGTPRAQKIEIDLADCPDLFPALCTVAALQGAVYHSAGRRNFD